MVIVSAAAATAAVTNKEYFQQQ